MFKDIKTILDENMGETYQVSAECINCDFKGKINILKGRKLRTQKCPECGCESLSKSILPSWKH